MLAAGLLAFAGAAWAQSEAPCPPAPLPELNLPQTAAAIAANQPLTIIALGSSSTRGWMASGIGHSYPADLQRLLEAGRPFAEFAVINRGIGGQLAADELARLDEDVIAVHPQLVIWQTGSNDALRHVAPAAFRKTVLSGIERLTASGADVILMDTQRSPRILASSSHDAVNRVLANLSAESGVNLFSRDQLMQSWEEAGAPLSGFVAHDGLHLNDLGYACTSLALARAILAALPDHTTRHYPPQ